MSNYKTELQSNNADLQSIVTQIDELGSIVSEQDTTISQIKYALKGSGGTTVDDIGVFTIDDVYYYPDENGEVLKGGPTLYPNMEFLFLKGMTFNDYYNSIFNQPFYNINGRLESIECDDYSVSIESYPKSDGVASSFYISEDGATRCAKDDIIKEIKYKLKSYFPMEEE